MDRLRNTRRGPSSGLVAALAAFLIIGHVSAATWGANSSIGIRESKYLNEKPGLGTASHWYVSEPLFGSTTYLIINYDKLNPDASTASRYRLFQINTEDKDAILAANPASYGTTTMLSAASTVYTSRILANGAARSITKVAIFGGRQRNGVFSQTAGTLGMLTVDNQFFVAQNMSDLPQLPNYMAGMTTWADRTYTAQVDRDNSGSAYVPIYVFGGFGNNGTDPTEERFLGDLWRTRQSASNISADGWDLVTPLNPEVAPEPRADATGVVVGPYFYLFGGRDSEGVFGDTWRLDMKNHNWTLLYDFGYVSNDDLENRGFHDKNPSGRAGPLSPPARYGHSMILTNSSADEKFVEDKTSLIILAGGTNGIHTFNDLWAFDVSSRKWNQLSMPKAGYKARAYGALFRRPGEPFTIYYIGGENSTGSTLTQYGDIWKFDIRGPAAPTPAFKRVPNAIISGVAGGILLSLIIMVVVLKLTDRNRN